ncbi:MAG: hypothetical protein H7144_01725 [Burkholderiales bacterium]|nr:hypothetical protein [Phycisphaerae bacterium]
MTYPPPPYPQSPYPQQSPYAPGPYPPSSAGRYAGIALCILGGIALLFGGCTGIVAFMFPSLKGNPEFQQQLAALDSQGISPVVVLWILATVFLLYAVIAILLGILLIRRVNIAVVFAMVFVSLVMILHVLNAAGGLIGGEILAAAVALMVACLHGWILHMLIKQMRAPAPLMPAGMPAHPAYHPPQYGQPMQGYYYSGPQPQPPSQPPSQNIAPQQPPSEPPPQ